MFNLQGSELIIILLLALVVLGPEKLPDAMRKAGRMYADLKKMASGFQEEFKAAIDEPMREMRTTADLLRDSADFTKLAAGERDEKPVSAQMSDAGRQPEPGESDDAVAAEVAVDELPFGTPDPAPAGSEAFESLPTPGAEIAAPTDEPGGGA